VNIWTLLDTCFEENTQLTGMARGSQGSSNLWLPHHKINVWAHKPPSLAMRPLLAYTPPPASPSSP